jgi:hypothetical protein
MMGRAKLGLGIGDAGRRLRDDAGGDDLPHSVGGRALDDGKSLQL